MLVVALAPRALEARFPEVTSRRRTYFILLIVTVAVGLAVHLHGSGLPPAIRDVLGDALWAAMIVWLVSLAAPNAALWGRAAVALAICCTVELAQLIKHPALEAMRSSTLGHLVLGSDFFPRDLVAYAGGIAAAVMLDMALNNRSS